MFKQQENAGHYARAHTLQYSRTRLHTTQHHPSIPTTADEGLSVASLGTGPLRLVTTPQTQFCGRTGVEYLYSVICVILCCRVPLKLEAAD